MLWSLVPAGSSCLLACTAARPEVPARGYATGASDADLMAELFGLEKPKTAEAHDAARRKKEEEKRAAEAARAAAAAAEAKAREEAARVAAERAAAERAACPRTQADGVQPKYSN